MTKLIMALAILGLNGCQKQTVTITDRKEIREYAKWSNYKQDHSQYGQWFEHSDPDKIIDVHMPRSQYNEMQQWLKTNNL